MLFPVVRPAFLHIKWITKMLFFCSDSAQQHVECLLQTSWKRWSCYLWLWCKLGLKFNMWWFLTSVFLLNKAIQLWTVFCLVILVTNKNNHVCLSTLMQMNKPGCKTLPCNCWTVIIFVRTITHCLLKRVWRGWEYSVRSSVTWMAILDHFDQNSCC